MLSVECDGPLEVPVAPGGKQHPVLAAGGGASSGKVCSLPTETAYVQ